jgi:hypothetical protein
MNVKKLAARMKQSAMSYFRRGVIHGPKERLGCHTVILTYGSGEWHLSVSVGEDLTATEQDVSQLEAFMEEVGVPPEKREGFTAARQFRGEKELPVVRHFMWAPDMSEVD